MRVVSFLDNQFYLSGVNAYWYAFASCLAASGHEVTTMVLDSGEEPWNETMHSSWPGRYFRLKYGGSPQHLAIRWADFLAEITPEVVIHHYSDAGLQLSRSVKGRINCVDTYVSHSDDPDHYNRVRDNTDLIEHVICVSDVCLSTVSNMFPDRKKQLSLVNYGFSASKFASPPTSTLNVLYAGRLEQYQKRVRDFVPLCGLLEGLRVKLHIAGDGSEYDFLRSRLGRYVDNGLVKFHCFLPETELFSLMVKCQVYLSLSDFEGLSTSLVQAMAHGLVPLVTSTVSGTDFLNHGDNALLFLPGELNLCAKHIIKLAEDGVRCMELMKNALATYVERFRPYSMCDQVEAFMAVMSKGRVK